MACPATTPSRLFRTLDPEQFRAAFQRFMADFSEPCRGAVAIDGKKVERLRETAGKTTSETAYYLLSAHPNGSTTSSAPIGAWKITSGGGSTWS